MEMEAVYVALASCAGVAVILIAISIPMYLGKIKRNNWYGFRTPKTLSSDEIWYPANKDSARNFIYGGVLILISALILYFLRTALPPSTSVIIMSAVTLVVIIGAVIKSFIFLSKLK